MQTQIKNTTKQNTLIKWMLNGLMLVLAWVVLTPSQTVFGAEDPQFGTSNDDIENMIEVGKSLIGQTDYVFGGGHHDWDEQKQLDVPTGLDNSSYVAWVLYRGMGIDLGYAPISGQFGEYFETVNVGSLDGVERGDLIADDRHIEIYLGQDDTGKHYSLTATNERSNVTITETNWGRGVTSKTVIRPNIADAKEGVKGLRYDESVIIEMWDSNREIGGSALEEKLGDGGGSSTQIIELDEEDEDNESAGTEGETPNKSTKSQQESLFTWLNPIVDFSGASNTHSKSNPEGKRIDGNNKGLKGHKQGFLDMFF